ncbi:MAG: hypothetical protein PHF75_02490 [Gallionella sp.]|nr:hypothetical protein [Gallionella sp.]
MENKLTLLIQAYGKLHSENHRLRQELAHAHSDNRVCKDKMANATIRLEKLLSALPEGQP